MQILGWRCRLAMLERRLVMPVPGERHRWAMLGSLGDTDPGVATSLGDVGMSPGDTDPRGATSLGDVDLDITLSLHPWVMVWAPELPHHRGGRGGRLNPLEHYVRRPVA